MNADTSRSRRSGPPLLHADVTEKIIGCFFDTYNELGAGYLEAVYQKALEIAFREAGLDADSQPEVDVWFRGHKVGTYRPDFVIAGVVVVELKAVTAMRDEHVMQLRHYLKATATEVGLLLNFGSKPTFRRMVLERA